MVRLPHVDDHGDELLDAEVDGRDESEPPVANDFDLVVACPECLLNEVDGAVKVGGGQPLSGHGHAQLMLAAASDVFAMASACWRLALVALPAGSSPEFPYGSPGRPGEVRTSGCFYVPRANQSQISSTTAS